MPASMPKQRLALKEPLQSLKLLLTSRDYFPHFAALLLLGEAALCLLVIRFVSYTEIDWSTYMQQVECFLRGERDYVKIKGDTGTLVYPAGHLYIYTALYHLTDHGRNIRLAQYLFAGLYVATQAVIFAIYYRCASIPQWTFVALVLSKRLHSIYMLRLFNDPIAMFFLYLAILVWTGRGANKWANGTVLFSVALSIKMNVLLFLPGLLFVLWVSTSATFMLVQLVIIASTQMLLAAPFVTTVDLARNYFRQAFDFSRQFLWEWTVNWRWIGEETFENPSFGQVLLLAHLAVLVVFAVRWSEDFGGVLRAFKGGLANREQPLSADTLVTILSTSNLVGILFARSLHYQFYSWSGHQLIFLAWHTPYETVQRFAILGAIEFGWNTFPSTDNSSLVLVFSMAVLLAGVYYGNPTGNLALSRPHLKQD